MFDLEDMSYINSAPLLKTGLRGSSTKWSQHLTNEIYANNQIHNRILPVENEHDNVNSSEYSNNGYPMIYVVVAVPMIFVGMCILLLVWKTPSSKNCKVASITCCCNRQEEEEDEDQ